MCIRDRPSRSSVDQWRHSRRRSLPRHHHPVRHHTHGPSSSLSTRNRREAAGPYDETRSSLRAASQRPSTPRERARQGADAPHLLLSDDLPAATPAAGELAELRDQVETFVPRQCSGLAQSVQTNAANAAALRQDFHGALAIMDSRIAEDRRILGELQFQ
eukprot:8394529-Pyramimonas_sp.AAC.1